MTAKRLTFWIRFTSIAAGECLENYFKNDFDMRLEKEMPKNQRFDGILFDTLPSEEERHDLHLSYPEAHFYFFSNEPHQGSTSGCTYIPVPVSFADLTSILSTPRTAVSHDLGAFVLFPSARRLHNKGTGSIDLLTEKEVDILLYLLEHQGEDVSKEELLENVWGYKSDTPTHTLETHIYNLRQKLDLPDIPPILVTTPRGYQLKQSTF